MLDSRVDKFQKYVEAIDVFINGFLADANAKEDLDISLYLQENPAHYDEHGLLMDLLSGDVLDLPNFVVDEQMTQKQSIIHNWEEVQKIQSEISAAWNPGQLLEQNAPLLLTFLNSIISTTIDNCEELQHNQLNSLLKEFQNYLESIQKASSSFHSITNRLSNFPSQLSAIGPNIQVHLPEINGPQGRQQRQTSEIPPSMKWSALLQGHGPGPTIQIHELSPEQTTMGKRKAATSNDQLQQQLSKSLCGYPEVPGTGPTINVPGLGKKG